jgi:hypothetical protein
VIDYCTSCEIRDEYTHGLFGRIVLPTPKLIQWVIVASCLQTKIDLVANQSG